MTQGEGQAKVPTTRFLLTPSPYLQRPGSDHAPDGKPAKPWVGPQGARLRGRTLNASGGQLPALDFASLPFNSSLMVTSPSAQRQKSWKVLTYLVTQNFLLESTA